MILFTRSALRASAAAKLQHAVELIRPQLSAVEERIREQAHAFDPAIEDYVAYACGSNGKRLRPVLALLAGAATGPPVALVDDIVYTIALTAIQATQTSAESVRA